MWGYWALNGCWSTGYSGCWGNSYAGYSAWPTVVAQAPPAAAPQKATVIVDLPADADLYVDGIKANVTSARRKVVSPPLQAGLDYVYTLKAEALRDGKPVTQTKQVTIRAGAVTQVRFDDLANRVPAHVTVRLPADAQLYVNDAPIAHQAATTSFDSPPLDRGKPYHYVFRAELRSAGRSTSETRKVTVEAGKRVQVVFDSLVPVKTAHR